MRFSVRCVLAGALGLLAIQCSVLTTFDGFVRGDAADASSDAALAGDGTTLVDGNAFDANGTARDGGGVVGDASGDAGRWCALVSPRPMFCDDFDDQDASFSMWTTTSTTAGATLAHDLSAFRSAPSSLLAATPGGPSSDQARLVLTPPGTVSRVRFAFDLRIDTRDPQTGYAEIVYVTFPDGFTRNFYFRVYQDSTANVFTAESIPDGSALQHNNALPTSITFDDWKRVSIDIDVGTAHAVTVLVDGVMVVNQTLESDLYPTGAVAVEPGIGYTGSPSSVWSMRFDNVTIDWN